MMDVALKDYLESRLIAERLLTDEKISTLIKDIEKTAAGLDVRLTYERLVTDEKILAILKDIEKTAAALDHRLETLNQLRGEVLEDRGVFVRKEQFDVVLKQLYMGLGAVGLLMLLIPMLAHRFWP